jgi:hypothetical protein
MNACPWETLESGDVQTLQNSQPDASNTPEGMGLSKGIGHEVKPTIAINVIGPRPTGRVASYLAQAMR